MALPNSMIMGRARVDSRCLRLTIPGIGWSRFCQDGAICGTLEGELSITGARGAMAINIELRPDEERALSERARGSGRDVTEYVHQVLQDHIRAASQDERAAGTPPIPDDLIDHDVIVYCERDADDSITLEEVRAATAKIQDSMARVVIEEERAERF